ncbi:class I SAM-dependent methyltransferase [Saccharopolyspora phatthalungensis]|uniref:SAM-dependent methyltransferase n=1 Tax=Saccharopolyspora phatthalungensis TaxID=664693 RepID=A0A840QKE2_9PSEU|nr:class I SAM-dependent methyltransferase [Saccharopolyspora phatthalungensis]MBB5159825.1 SAM-dependent methyltransferase [Saccharopolyspora phatthalungensis]
MTHSELLPAVRRAIDDLGAAFLVPLVALGRRLGLWQAMDQAGPLTAEQLAARTNTSRPCVREWLAAQAAAGYLTHDPADDTFVLPEDIAAVVARDDSPTSYGAVYELFDAVYRDQDKVEAAFTDSGGFAWQDRDAAFFPAVERFTRTTYRSLLVQEWLPAFDNVTSKLTRGAQVADVACGYGTATILLAQHYPASTVTGFDFHPDSIGAARAAADTAGAGDNLSFVTAAADAFPGHDYDLITVLNSLHDMGNPQEVLSHIRRALAEDGTVMLVESQARDHPSPGLDPIGRWMYAFSTHYCVPCALAQDGGHALGNQVTDDQLRDLAAEAGFVHFRRVAESTFSRVIELRAH